MSKLWIGVGCALFVSLCLSTGGNAMESSIENFEQLDTNLYRGAQPSREELAQLKAQGITTIINFRHEKGPITKETTHAAELGLEYVSIPWTIWGRFKPDVFERFLGEIADKEARPVFFHCRRGVERTGIISGLYKVHTGALSEENALAYIHHSDVKPMWKPFVKKKFSQYAKLIQENKRA